MKADTVFRFVAVRPPTWRDVIIVIPGDNEARRRIEEGLFDLEHHGIRRIEARRALCEKIVRGADYWFRLPGAEAMARNTPQLKTLMRQHASNPNFEQFMNTVRQLAAAALPESQAGWVASDGYKILKMRLWTGYYALTLYSRERVQDMAVLSEWLKALFLVESRSADNFAERVRQLRRLRLSSVFAWLAKGQAPTRDRGAAPRPTLDALRKRLADVNRARQELDGLFADMLDRPDPPEPDSRTERKILRVSGDSNRDAWWDVSDKDRKLHAGAFAIAAESGIPHDTLALPDVVNALDTLIANLTFQLDHLQRRERRRPTGNLLTRVRR